MFTWLVQRIKWSGDNRDRAQAHMTFGQTSLGHTISRTGLFLKKQLWIWPIAAVVLLAIIGYAVNTSIRHTMEATLRSQLQTLLSVERSMLEQWFKVQESSALTLANNQQIRETVAQLLAAESDREHKIDLTAAEPSDRIRGDLQLALAKELEPGLSSHDFVGFILANKRQQIVAANNAELIGRILPEYEGFLTRALNGKSNVCAPFSSVALVKDEVGRVHTGTPTMFVCVPVRDNNFQVVAALALRIRPEKEFTEIL